MMTMSLHYHLNLFRQDFWVFAAKSMPAASSMLYWVMMDDIDVTFKATLGQGLTSVKCCARYRLLAIGWDM